jgi:hypothetical protein
MSARGSICTEAGELLLEIRASRVTDAWRDHPQAKWMHAWRSGVRDTSSRVFRFCCQLARCLVSLVCFGCRVARLLCCVTCGEAEVLVRLCSAYRSCSRNGHVRLKVDGSARIRAVGRRSSTDWEGYAGVVVQNGCGTLLLEDDPSEMMRCMRGVSGFEEC